MQLMTFLAFFAGLVAAAPASVTVNDENILAGPLPYDDLRQVVAEMRAQGALEEKRDAVLNRRISEGVYMCSGSDFTGDCYYGSYPISVAIYPDPYWVSRIVSVGPDEGGWCDFFGGNACDVTKFSQQIFYYPGGNLEGDIANNMGCFYCNPK